jgi:hypothetical protein
MSKKSQNSVATATADTQIKKVIWTKKILEYYLDICITEIHARNRPRTYFNKTRLKNMVNKFNEKTKKQY